MRDTPYKPGDHQSDPVERLFVATAVVSLIAFLVWFAFFAGAPFPSSSWLTRPLRLGARPRDG